MQVSGMLSCTHCLRVFGHIGCAKDVALAINVYDTKFSTNIC